MHTMIRKRSLLVVWLFLIMATGLVWWLGMEKSPAAGRGRTWVAVSLLIVAFIKVRLVGLYFMELKDAPWAIRLIFESWVVGTCSAILVFYFLGGV